MHAKDVHCLWQHKIDSQKVAERRKENERDSNERKNDSKRIMAANSSEYKRMLLKVNQTAS